MPIRSHGLPRSGPGLAGDPRVLAARLGSAEGFDSIGDAVACRLSGEVADKGSLRRCLREYVRGVLVAVELPTIVRAFEHAHRYEIRELIELDGGLVMPPVPEAFLRASCRVGRIQLRRLRPLRDERRVRRYWSAIEAGEAKGWHTVVYGLTMAVFSFPLRQALVSYGNQTVRGFIGSAGDRLALGSEHGERLAREAAGEFRCAVEFHLGGSDFRGGLGR